MRSTWLSLLTDPSITIGISTPNVSPEGDWAKVLFKNVAKVYRSEPGASIISQHAIPLVGGNHTAEDLWGKPPQASCCGMGWTLPWSTQATLTG